MTTTCSETKLETGSTAHTPSRRNKATPIIWLPCIIMAAQVAYVARVEAAPATVYSQDFNAYGQAQWAAVGSPPVGYYSPVSAPAGWRVWNAGEVTTSLEVNEPRSVKKANPYQFNY